MINHLSFVFDYFPDQFNAQEIGDKAVVCLPALKFVTDWFVTNKMLEKFVNFLFCNDGVDLGDIDSEIVTFVSNDMDLVTINLNNINLHDDCFNEDDSESYSY